MTKPSSLTKAELLEMLAEAVRNTQPVPVRSEEPAPARDTQPAPKRKAGRPRKKAAPKHTAKAKNVRASAGRKR
jgi:hypothetical protein